MRRYRTGAHAKYDLKVHIVWVPKYRKRILTGPVARGYFAVTSGAITDDMINEYINEQEGEPVGDDSRFQIDST
jgi:REP element-mobilizing transposase RayT